MLQLVMGRAGSGKSTFCLREVERLAKAGKRAVLIVPEQSSFALERTLTLRLGDTLAPFATVKSFKSLSGDIFAECGGGARKRVNEAVRASLVRRAVAALSEQVVCFRRHRRDFSFFAMTAAVIEELKNAGVTPEQMETIATFADSSLSGEKLREIAAIYRMYEVLLGDKYLDAASETAAAAAASAHSAQFFGCTLFFDGFTGFTEPQLEMIGHLLLVCDDIYVTLCCDNLDVHPTDVFATVRKSGEKLLAIAARKNIAVSKPIYLKDRHRFAADGLSTLETFLAGSAQAGVHDGVYRIAGDDPYDEIERVADEIVALVRDHGYRYRDIVVIARDLNSDRAALTRTFARFGIPYFCDTNRNMLYAPVMVLVLAALDLASGIKSETVLSLLKTSLCDLDDDIVGELENYLYIWNIDRAAWHLPFTENPGGLGAPWDGAATETLARLETARQAIVRWIAPVADAAKENNAGDLVRAIYETMRRCGALRTLELAAGDAAREASIGLELLDQLFQIVDGEAISIAELRETARLLAAQTAVGDIPPTLEQVLVGTADRMRTDNPRAAFVIGLNDGLFPRTAFDTPLLTGAERDLLAEHGAELTRNFTNSAVMEELYLYRALSCAAERVYLCYAKHGQSGAALLPSAKIDAFLERYGARTPETEQESSRGVVNAQTALYQYANAAAHDNAETLAALDAAAGGDLAGLVGHAAAEPHYALAEPNLPRQLLGAETTLSASRIETFAQCRFRYFLQYILKIKPLAKAEISPIAAGNFVHGVMEHALEQLGETLMHAPKARLAEAVEQTAQAYIEQELGASAAGQPRIAYLIARLKAQALRLLQQLQREQQNSAFRPCDYELVIGEGGVEPLTLQTPDGVRVRVIGKVDRVDIYRQNEKSYIRVVDYKTGTKEFKLRDVYYGLQVQMLLYLFTIAQHGAARYGDIVPAAVLYLPSDPKLPAEQRDGESMAQQAYRMDGLVLDDPEIVEAMEHGVGGVFLPVTRDRYGNLKTDKLASLARLGAMQEHITKTVVDMASALYRGDIEACPTVDGNKAACDFCDYAAVCRRDRVERERVLEPLKDKELFVQAEGGELDG